MATTRNMTSVFMTCSLPLFVVFLTVAIGFAAPPVFSNEEVLALELSGDLLGDPALVALIAQDLAAIVAEYPEVSEIDVQPDWQPGALIVGLYEDAWIEYQAGTFDGLDALNAQYGPVSIEAPTRWLLLEFTQVYNPEVLTPIYAEAVGVEHVSPNYVTSVPDLSVFDDISIEQLGHYYFQRAWPGPPSQCFSGQYWEFTVTNGDVALISETCTPNAVGEPPPTQSVLLEQNQPNPFNPHTTISYRLDAPGRVSLRVYDASGRLLTRLREEVLPAGDYDAHWDGTDSRGSAVASGIYLYELVVDGRSYAKKMVLAR